MDISNIVYVGMHISIQCNVYTSKVLVQRMEYLLMINHYANTFSTIL